MQEPSAAFEPQQKGDAPDGPVCEHADPDGDGAKAQDPDQENRQGHPAGPHGGAGQDQKVVGAVSQCDMLLFRQLQHTTLCAVTQVNDGMEQVLS